MCYFKLSWLLCDSHLVEEQIVPSRISQPDLSEGKSFKKILESGMKLMQNCVVWRHLRLTSKNFRTRSFSSGKEAQSEVHHVSPSPNSVPKCVALTVEDFMSGYYEVRLWLLLLLFRFWSSFLWKLWFKQYQKICTHQWVRHNTTTQYPVPSFLLTHLNILGPSKTTEGYNIWVLFWPQNTSFTERVLLTQH